MGMPSMPELLIILTIVVLLFGAKKIPDLAKGIGSGIKNFKKAVNEEEPEAEAKAEDKSASASKKSLEAEKAEATATTEATESEKTKA
jgi:sec-independent protein translocase protein TatA